MLHRSITKLLDRLRGGVAPRLFRTTACLRSPASASRRSSNGRAGATSAIPTGAIKTSPKVATPSIEGDDDVLVITAGGRPYRKGLAASKRLITPPIPDAATFSTRAVEFEPEALNRNDEVADGVPFSREEDAEVSAETSSAMRRAQSLLHPKPHGRGRPGDSFSTRPREDSTPEAAPSDDTLSTSTGVSLINPFCGLHAHLARTYRLEQFAEDTTPADVIFAKQEAKSAAFSFLRFKASPELYDAHWAVAAGMKGQLEAIQQQVATAGKRATHRLFNNDLGVQSLRVATSYPLLIAQRLLLFPDNLRHWHTLCGRDRVPCDFYADVDLPGETAEGGEQVLLEILNYLEVRLPGIGFTDPFFLILANASSMQEDARRGRGKISFHLHARSMTYRADYLALGAQQLGLIGGATSPQKTTRRVSKSRRKRPSSEAEKVVEVAEEGEAEEDDLSDLVNVVEGGGATQGAVSPPKVVAFEDYRTVRLLADEVNQTLGKAVIDDNCYRAHGMLRCAFSAKLRGPEGATGGLQPLLTAKDPALQAKLNAMHARLRGWTDPEILEMSFCGRFLNDPDAARRGGRYLKTELLPKLPMRTRRAAIAAATSGKAPSPEVADLLQAAAATSRHRFKLLRLRHIRGGGAGEGQEYDAHGNLVSPFLTEAAKWRRFRQVVAKLQSLPPHAADSFDVWVRVGLALHNFSNEDHVFDEWVRFSIRCPQKFSREACRKKWVQFERNPDALNWRRGFNYLNSTIWKQV
ncbi:unnamed protein product [Phytomonas sp. EM1]|nr:unnamed protein product [Phytomonas sp. EM1]|eukprot:CCW65755.1 unnamed protein product [Phytomonas sp. isolate EM1]